MISKTIDQWIEETEKYGSIYYEKYAGAWTDYKCPGTIRDYYCKIAKRYWDLRDVLQHIKSYGARDVSSSKITIINKNMCSACRHNQAHVESLLSTYGKYSKWVNQVIWNS